MKNSVMKEGECPHCYAPSYECPWCNKLIAHNREGINMYRNAETDGEWAHECPHCYKYYIIENIKQVRRCKRSK